MCFSHIGKESQWRMSILAHLYLRTSLNLPLAYYKTICCNVRREKEDRIKITFWFIYECKRWLLMKTSEPRNQLFLVWSPRGTAGKKNPKNKKPIARNDTPQGDSILQCFFFPPSECYITSYSSVFFFKVLVHEVHIKVLIPHWL